MRLPFTGAALNQVSNCAWLLRVCPAAFGDEPRRLCCFRCLERLADVTGETAVYIYSRHGGLEEDQKQVVVEGGLG